MEKPTKPPRRNGVGRRRGKVTVNGTARLLDAARRNDSKEVKELVQVKRYVGITQEDLNTALLMCCRNSCLESAKILLENNAYYDFQDEDQWTSLHMAAYCDNLQMVQLLLEHKADPTLLDVDGNFPVDMTHNAATKSLLMRHMAQHGVHEEDFHSARSRLARAMLVNVRNMIGKGRNISFLNKNGVTPLHTAAAFGYYEVGRQLLEAGALVDMLDEFGHTPLFVAAKFNQREMVQLLLSRGADKTAVREPKLAEFVGEAAEQLKRIWEDPQRGWGPGKEYLHQQTISNIWKLTSITKVDMGRERDVLQASRQAPVQCLSLKESSELVRAYRNTQKELIYDECVTIASDTNGEEDGYSLVKGTINATTSLPCRLTYKEKDYDDPDVILHVPSPKLRPRATPVVPGERRKVPVKTSYSHSKIILAEPTQQPVLPPGKKHTYVNVPESSEAYIKEEIYDDTAAIPGKHTYINVPESSKACTEEEIYDDTAAAPGKHTYVNVPESSKAYMEEEIYDDTAAAPGKGNIRFHSSSEVDEIYDDTVTTSVKGIIHFQQPAEENEIYNDTTTLSSAERDHPHPSSLGNEIYDDTVFLPSVVKTHRNISPENNDTYDDTTALPYSNPSPYEEVTPENNDTYDDTTAFPYSNASPYEEVTVPSTDIDYEEIDDEPPTPTTSITYSKGRKKLSQRRSLSSDSVRNGLNRSPPLKRGQVFGEESPHHPSPQPREHKLLTKSQSADATQPPVMKNRPLPTLPPVAAASPSWRSRMFPPSLVQAVPSGLKRRDSTPNNTPPPVPQHRRPSPPTHSVARVSQASSQRPQSTSYAGHSDNMAPTPHVPVLRRQSESFLAISTIVEDTEPAQAPPTPPRHRKPKSPDVNIQKKSDWGHSPTNSYGGQPSRSSYSPPISTISERQLDNDQESSTPSGLLAEIQKVKLKKSPEPPSLSPPPHLSPKPAIIPSSRGDMQSSIMDEIRNKKLKRVSATPTCQAPVNGHLQNSITGNDNSQRVRKYPVPPPKPAKPQRLA